MFIIQDLEKKMPVAATNLAKYDETRSEDGWHQNDETWTCVTREQNWHFMFVYPLVMTNSLLLNMTIEIVNFPIKNGWIFP